MKQHLRTGRRRLAVIVVGLLAVSACGSGDDDSAPAPGEALVVNGEEIADAALWAAAHEEGTVNFYTTMSQPPMEALVSLFEEQVDLELDAIRLSGGPMFERVMSEKGAGTLAADVTQQTDLSLALKLAEADVWQPYCFPAVEELAADYQQEDCSFWASQQAPYMIAYNTQLVSGDDIPETWQDLLDSKWQDKIAIQHIGGGGSAYARDVFLRRNFGVEYWEALASQDPAISETGQQPVEQLARGEVSLATSTANNVVVAVADGAPLGLVSPPEGVPTFAFWTGLTTGGSHPNAAKVFVRWLLSTPGQEALASAAGDWPVVDGVPGPSFNDEKLPPLKDLHPQLMERTEQFASVREQWIGEWNEIFGYQP